MYATLIKTWNKNRMLLFLPDILAGTTIHPGSLKSVYHWMHGIDAQHEFIRDTTGRGTYHYGGAGTIEVVSPAGGV
jgi:hypothetical protein